MSELDPVTSSGFQCRSYSTAVLPNLRRPLEALLAQHSRGGKSDMLFRRLDGSQFSGEILSAGIELSGEKRILVVVQDVSERKQLESEIIEIANRDADGSAPICTMASDRSSPAFH